ncbi:acyltransferase [Rufibacter sp. LB8]|uniref:acyltransferase family protein n=1 Tax=Rufibacter sp. LB8 TaxID=2777781 RepID=UPI00178C65B5|nr:acyltransferase [Rufibacter sp. LB8]
MNQTISEQVPAVKFLLLQVLRGVAVVLVVHFHAIEAQTLYLDSSNHSWQEGFVHLKTFGAVGVDLFFVISGFIIVYTSRRYLQRGAGGEFFLKRLLRIVPLYWLVTGLVLVSQWALKQPVAGVEVWKSLLFFPFFDEERFIMPVLAVGWTLSFELLFYLLTALLLFSKSRHYMLWVILLLLLAISAGWWFPSPESWLVFATNPMLYEFVYGTVIGLLYLKTSQQKGFTSGLFPKRLVLVGAVGFLATLLVGYEHMGFLAATLSGEGAFMRALLWGLPSAFVVAGCVFLETSQVITVPRFLLALGDASFSIYLMHTFPIKALTVFWNKFELPFLDWFVLLATLLSVLVGWFFHVLVERRMLTWANSVFLPKQPLSR